MNCALTILLPNFSCGHDASCPYLTILFAFWVIIIMSDGKKGRYIGGGIGVGAALGILFGTQLGGDIAFGVLIGAVVGLIVGAIWGNMSKRN